MRIMSKDRPRGEERLILSNTNQNMRPRRDVTPSPGKGGVTINLMTRGRDSNGRGWEDKVVMGAQESR